MSSVITKFEKVISSSSAHSEVSRIGTAGFQRSQHYTVHTKKSAIILVYVCCSDTDSVKGNVSVTLHAAAREMNSLQAIDETKLE